MNLSSSIKALQREPWSKNLNVGDLQGTFEGTLQPYFHRVYAFRGYPMALRLQGANIGLYKENPSHPMLLGLEGSFQNKEHHMTLQPQDVKMKAWQGMLWPYLHRVPSSHRMCQGTVSIGGIVGHTMQGKRLLNDIQEVALWPQAHGVFFKYMITYGTRFIVHPMAIIPWCTFRLHNTL